MRAISLPWEQWRTELAIVGEEATVQPPLGAVEDQRRSNALSRVPFRAT